MWRRLLIIALGSIVLLALLDSYVRSAHFGSVVRDVLVRLAQRHDGLRLQVSEVQAQLLPPALRIDAVSFVFDGDSQVRGEVAEAFVQPRLWPSAQGLPSLNFLRLDGLHLQVRLPERAAAAAQKPSKRDRGLPFDVQRLQLRDAQIAVSWGQQTVDLRGVAAELRPGRWQGRPWQIEVDSLRPGAWAALPASVRLGLGGALGNFGLGLQNGVQARAEGLLQGSLDRPSGVVVHDATLTLGELQAKVQGTVRRRAPHAFAWQIQVDGPLGGVGTALHGLGGLGGTLHLGARIDGDKHDASLHTDGRIDGLRLRDEAIGDIQVQATLRDGALSVENLRIVQAQAGMLTASGRLDVRHPRLVLHAAARLHKASVPQLLRHWTPLHAWLHGTLSGDVRLEGALRPLQVGAEMGLSFADLRVAHAAAAGPPALQLAAGTLRGKLHVDSDGVHLSDVRVGGPTTQWRVDGSFKPHDAAHFFALKLQTRDLDLAALGPLGGMPFGGIATAEGELVGAAANPQVRLRACTQGLRVGRVYVGQARGTLRFAPPTLFIDDAQIDGDPRQSNHGAKIFATAQLGLLQPGLPLRIEARADSLDAPLLLEALGLAPQVAGHFSGVLGGRLSLKGSARQPQGSAHLESSSAAVDDTLLGAVKGDVDFGRSAWLSAVVEMAPPTPNGRLRAAIDMDSETRFRLRLKLDDAPLRILSAWAPQVMWDGLVRGDVDLREAHGRPCGHVVLHASQLVAMGIPFGSVDLRGDADAGTLDWQGDAWDGAVPLHGQLTLHGAWAYHVSGHAHAFDLSRLHPLGAHVGLVADTDFVGDGSLTRPQDTDLRFTVSAAQLRLAHVQAALVGKVSCRLLHGVLHLDDSLWRGPKLEVQLAGTLNLADSEIRATLAAQGDVAAAESFLPEGISVSGPIALRTTLSGTLQDPLQTGSLRLDDVQLVHIESQQKLSRLAANVTLAGRAVIINAATAKLGSGTIALLGEATHAPQGVPHLNLHAELRGASLSAPPDLDATVSGNVGLSGPLDNLLLAGDLHLDAVHYTARLELNRLVPRSDRLPLRSRLPLSNRSMRLALRLLAPNNILVSSSVLEAELQADLTLTGTLVRPGLLGNITPLWARARYRDNAFDIVRASIDFTDEYRIFTEYSLQARTHACNMTADVTITGSTDSYTITAAGQDEHGRVDSQDVLACLQFGLRLHDFQGNQRAPAGYSDALPGSLDALWTVSGLDTKVRSMLPIDVDELRLTSGWSSLSQRTVARVLVGKELSDKVMLKYSRSLDAYNDQALSLEYRLGARAVMQGNWLSLRDVPIGDFGLDFRLHWDLR